MRYLFLTIFIFCGFGFLAAPASAAIWKVESDFRTLRVGDVFTVDVVLNTELQTINAIETKVVFPYDLLQYIESSEGASVVSLWVEKPVKIGDGVIYLSGIIPGGFMQKEARIASLTFKVIKDGQANISIDSPSALLNDGLGTESDITVQNLHISIIDGVSTMSLYISDDELPESFVPEIINDPDIFGGDSVLIFATNDKGSGLDRFEIKEGVFGRYHQADSPYQIFDQSLGTKILIKAIDKNGNERIEIFYPQNWQPWYKHSEIIVTILLLCVLTLLIFGWYLKRLFLK